MKLVKQTIVALLGVAFISLQVFKYYEDTLELNLATLLATIFAFVMVFKSGAVVTTGEKLLKLLSSLLSAKWGSNKNEKK